MSCPCNKQTEPLPLVADDCGVCEASLVQVTNDASCVDSSPSEGATVPSWATDATVQNTEVTLLARLGTKLSKFSGTGFLRIVDGKASLVKSMPLTVVDLYHKWFKVSAGSKPVLGEPLDYEYKAVADCNGNLHAQRGLDGVESVTVWNGTEKVFQEIDTANFPKCVKSVLPRAEEIELVGYEPLGENDSATLKRCLKSLKGASGLVVLEERDTVITDCLCEGCDAPAAKVTVATVLPLPEGAATHTLKYSLALGVHWVEDED